MRLRQRLIDGQRQPLTVFAANTVGGGLPAGVIQQLPGFGLVEGEFIAEIDIAGGRAGQHGGGLRVVSGEQRLHHLPGVGGMEQGLTHPQVGDQWVIRAEAQAVVDPAGRGSVDLKSLIGSLLFIVGLHLANKARLTCQQRADTHAVFRRHNIGDAVEVSGPLLGNVFRPPLVILARHQRQLAAWFFILHDEGAGADNMSGIAQLFKITLQGAERYQTGADGGGSLQEARRRLVEVEFYRQRVDHFAALVVIDDL